MTVGASPTVTGITKLIWVVGVKGCPLALEKSSLLWRCNGYGVGGPIGAVSPESSIIEAANSESCRRFR